jgi:hypothetical protein
MWIIIGVYRNSIIRLVEICLVNIIFFGKALLSPYLLDISCVLISTILSFVNRPTAFFDGTQETLCGLCPFVLIITLLVLLAPSPLSVLGDIVEEQEQGHHIHE